MDHLLSAIEFVDITGSAQGGSGQLAGTWDALFWISLFALVILICVAVAFGAIKKSRLIAVSSIAAVLVTVMCVSAVFKAPPQANADSGSISITPSIKAETNDNTTSITAATITNNSTYDYVLHDITLSCDDDAKAVGNWQVKIGDVSSQIDFNETLTFEMSILLGVGASADVELTTDINHSSVQAIAGKAPYIIDVGAVQIASIGDVKVNDKIQPNDVADTTIYVGWKINSTAKGITQSAYQIVVGEGEVAASTSAGAVGEDATASVDVSGGSGTTGSAIFDTGKVESSQTSSIKCTIPWLVNSSSYTVSVKAWDQYGNLLEPTNATSSFSTALIGEDPMDPSAQYLSFTDTRLTDPNNRATKNFTLDYDIILCTNENKTCFGLENSKNFTYLHMFNKTDDDHPSQTLSIALGQQIAGQNVEMTATELTDINFADDIAGKVTHVGITSTYDTGYQAQTIKVDVTPQGGQVASSRTFVLNSSTPVVPTDLKKIGMYNDVHKQVKNVEGNSDYSYRSMLTNIVATNTTTSSTKSSAYNAQNTSTNAGAQASTSNTLATDASTQANSSKAYASDANLQGSDSSTQSENTTTQNPTTVYSNDFSSGKLGFYHEYSARITERDNKNWIEVGFSTPDSNWGNEPLCEYYNTEGNFPAFRTTVDINKNVQSAKLYTTGLGTYDCFINGQRIYNNTASGPQYYELKNNYTEYGQTQYYLTFDVTPMLTSGTNALCAITSDGWWSDKITNHWGLEDAFKCQMVITYTDGTTQTIVSNTRTWKTCAASPMYKAEMFSGEAYDSRTNLDWMQPSFDDSACDSALGSTCDSTLNSTCDSTLNSTWTTPTANTEFNGTLSAWPGDKIIVRSDLTQKPVSTQLYTNSTGAVEGVKYGNIVMDQTVTGSSFNLKKGQTAIIDFGQILSGWENLTINGASGTNVTIRHAEIINETDGIISRANFGPGGSANYYNLRSCKATTNYICNGSTQTYHPTLTYYGFRYIEITATADVTISNVSASVVTSVNTDTASMTTSNAKINQLLSNGKWGMYDNYVGVPSDCPQRDERQGWTADTQIFSQTGMYLGSNKGFLEKFCKDVRDAQTRYGSTGILPATAPFGGWGGNAWGATGWADAGVIVPYTLYEMYGDTSILQDSWDSMDLYVGTWIPTNDSDDATSFHRGPTTMLGDWHVPEQATLNRQEIKNVIACEYYLWDLQIMCKTARVLGKDQATISKYDAKYTEILNWFWEHFYNDDDGIIYPESQTIAAYALYLDILPSDEAKQKVAGQLCQNIEDYGNKLKTGFLGTRVLLDALVKCGHADVAYKVLKSQDNPSWLLSVNNGATTFWERWDSYTKENGYFNIDGLIDYTNSLNHYSYGAVCGWMYKNMLGINSDEESAGFKHINLSPYPCTDNTGEIDLSHVSGSFESAQGTISVDSNFTGSSWTYAFTTPGNTTTTLTVPKLGFSNFTFNGKSIYDLDYDYDGAELEQESSDAITIRVANGSFSFFACN